MNRARLLILAAYLLVPADSAMAHPEGFSGMHAKLTANRVSVALTVHTRDMGSWFPPAQYPDYVADVTAALERTADELIEIQIDGQTQSIVAVHAYLLEVGLIEVDIDCELPASADSVELLIWSKHLIQLPRDHQQLLFIEDRREVAGEDAEGEILLDDVLTLERDAAVVTVAPMNRAAPEAKLNPTPRVDAPADVDDSVQAATEDDQRQPKVAEKADGPTSRISFFLFGVEHIITGYDHLLFLAALMLACTTLSEAATIVTCFTVAHSITLAMAALDWVHLPPQLVEPAIALSIVYVALENLFAKGEAALWRRATVTCLFGLIHGLGFASALREIGLRQVPGGVLWPLLKFNLGVEAGQLCVAAIALPLLLLAKRNERVAKAMLQGGSAAVACLGTYWLVTRIASY